MAVPFLYYGTQVVAAPFFPDYSFMRQAASLLGSNLSTRPLIFNAGVIATGLATLLAVPGFLVAFENVGREPVLDLDHVPGALGKRNLEPMGRLLPLA